MIRWHDEDRFWETFGLVLFDETRWQAASQEVDALLRLLQPEAGASILDLCCGPGRHSLELARRGFRVTGADRTAAFLAEARRRADAEGLPLELVQSDMRHFRRPGAFDLVINMFTSFGFFEDPVDDLQVARNMWESLRPGGKAVLEMMGKEVLARVFVERSWLPLSDGSIFFQERRVARDWSWIENRWMILKDATLHEFQFGHRLYSAAELRQVLSQAGFSSVQAYGSLDGTPYDHQARRLVMVAVKG
ncbi:MAG: class I SAM-dependent methyltransferase [Bacillota bacterium]